MENNKKWNFFAYASLADAFDGLGGDYGEKSLHGNAAVAMFLLASAEARERYIQLIMRAKRASKNGGSMLENLIRLAEESTQPAAARGDRRDDTGPASPPISTRTPPGSDGGASGVELVEEVEKELDASDKRRRGNRGRRPPRSATG